MSKHTISSAFWSGLFDIAIELAGLLWQRRAARKRRDRLNEQRKAHDAAVAATRNANPEPSGRPAGDAYQLTMPLKPLRSRYRPLATQRRSRKGRPARS